MSINHNRGFSILEVMISLAILAVGLLGLAGLQARAHFAEIESFSKGVALSLVQDMSDRVLANLNDAKTCATNCYDRSGVTFGTGNTTFGACSGLAVANRDVCEWDLALKGAGERTSGGTALGSLNNARGCIQKSGLDYIIQVAWQGAAQTTANPSALGCGNGLITPENTRRVISRTVSIARLAS